ncbi:MAG: M24B family metallopeptidase, partial [Pseudomonadota bacterium]
MMRKFQSFDAPPNDARAIAAARISQLQQELANRGLAAYLVPRADRFQGEYVAPADERLAWLTGFTGSAGHAVVTPKSAALFVDGRYTLQSRAQAPDPQVEIQDAGPLATAKWLKTNLSDGDLVGFDPWLTTVRAAEQLEKNLKPAGIKLRAVGANLIDRLWRDRPAAPSAPISSHPAKLAGRSAAEKVADIQSGLKEAGADAVILTQTDSLCWLLNIRGADVAHNPVVLAFAIVPAQGPVQAFIDPARVPNAVAKSLKGIATFAAPETFDAALKVLKTAASKVQLDPATAAYAIARRIGPKLRKHAPDPCVLPKAIKTDAEIAGSRAAHLRDGAAMVRFLAWLETAIADGEPVTEIHAAEQLEQFRQETGALKEISFDTISGSGPNGAIVHYRVTDATNRKLKKGELYLVDSGAQYADGTTDITRTIAIGRPTKQMRRHATLVLKGHIAIATARFPVGTRGVDLDPFARRALWDAGLDYAHGTGHGVGSFLSVHEGPQGISRRTMVALKPGMIVSNEPGYY